MDARFATAVAAYGEILRGGRIRVRSVMTMC